MTRSSSADVYRLSELSGPLSPPCSFVRSFDGGRADFSDDLLRESVQDLASGRWGEGGGVAFHGLFFWPCSLITCLLCMFFFSFSLGWVRVPGSGLRVIG